MKKILNIHDGLVNKISYYHVLFFLVFLPFNRLLSQWIFISLFIHTLIFCKRTDLKKLIEGRLLFQQMLFLILAVSAFWSTDKKLALTESIRILPLFLFPSLFRLSSLDFNNYRSNFLLAFTLTCVLVIIYLEVDAFHIIFFNHLPLRSILSIKFINDNFSNPIELHPTYLAMFLVLAISFLLTFLSKSTSYEKYLYFAGILILFAGCVQLSSKSGIVALVIIFLLSLCFLPSTCARHWSRLTAIGLILILLICIFNVNGLRQRLVIDFQTDLSMQNQPHSRSDPRIKRWQCSWELIGNAAILGYGIGSEKPLLKEKYFQKKLYNSYLNELDAHNQYMSVMISAGLVGLITFMLTLGHGFIKGFNKKDFVMISFLVIISVVGFSENILMVNKGIFFYAFFMGFFFSTQTSPELNPPANN